MENQNIPANTNKEVDINLRQLFEQYLFYWKWFVLSILLALGIALVYLRYAEKIYNTTAKILLKDERSGASGELSGIVELNSSMGLGGRSAAFVTDQIEVLSSRRLIRKVVDQHNLNITYAEKGKIRSSEVLETEMPFSVHPQGDQDSTKLLIEVSVQSQELLEVVNMVNEEKVSCSFDKPFKIGKEIVVFTRNNEIPLKVGSDYSVTVIPKNWAVDNIRMALEITPSKESQSYIVNFAMQSTVEKKAGLIINTLIDVYNTDLTNDKLRMTRATSDFINKRLLLISKDLSGADEKAADFKTTNSMVDMSTEAGVFLNSATDNDKKVLEYQTQLKLVDHMNDYFKSQEIGKLLPSNIGLQDVSIANSIEAYNKLILERDDLLKSASDKNPAVVLLNDNILEKSRNIFQSLQNYRKVTQLALNSIKQKSNEIRSRINAIPSQEQGFKKILRQQQTVESLY
ncbi:MAG: GumC family protein, partial [Sphingobacterium sp.]